MKVCACVKVCVKVCACVKCAMNLTMLFVQCQKARMQLNLFPVGKQIFVSQRYSTCSENVIYNHGT